MKNLVVLGAGWLGRPLCQKALDLGWEVQGTRTTPSGENRFEKQLYLDGEHLVHDITLRDAWWVCAIPPRARKEQSNYLSLLKQVLTLSELFNAKGFLLCSSSGVYAQSSGHYTEQSDTPVVTQRQALLLNAEQQVLASNGKVVRLAGLIGPNREPGRFVAGKQLGSSSHSLVNMVHQQDVINGIFCLLESWSDAQPIYNLCHPFHPTRQDYYKQKCAQLGTQAPTFSNDHSLERIIDGSAITKLGFAYQNDI